MISGKDPQGVAKAFSGLSKGMASLSLSQWFRMSRSGTKSGTSGIAGIAERHCAHQEVCDDLEILGRHTCRKLSRFYSNMYVVLFDSGSSPEELQYRCKQSSSSVTSW